MKNLYGTKWVFTFTIWLAGVCTPLICQAGGKVAAWGDKGFGQTSLPNGLDNVKAIAAGWRHNVALKTDGTVVAWGYNEGGATNVPSGLTNVTAVSAKGGFSLALRANGTVVKWGNGSADPQLDSLSNVVAVAAGWWHWVVLKSDGTVATGGVGITSPTNVPPGLTNIVAIAAGIEYSVALKADGTVVSWGLNTSGQTNVPPGLSNVVGIATGFSHNLALKADGTVVAWGSVGDIGVPPGLSNVTAIAAGLWHNLALKSDGSVVAWWAAHNGIPDYGQTLLPAGLSNVKAIAGGEEHSLALVFDGPPEIVQQPEGATILPQSNVVISVVVHGLEPLVYHWSLNGHPLNDSTRISGANSRSLNISNAQFADTGNYTVVVSNAFGSVTSLGAVLTVVGPPVIVEQSTNRTVRAGTNLSFVVVANGTPPLSYQWSLNGTNLPGKTSNSFNLSNVQPFDSGNYSVLITNAYGEARADMQLTVTNSTPYFLKGPFVRLNGQITSTNLSATIGSSVVFEFEAKGSTPMSVQWRFDGTDIPNATNATLELSHLQYSQAGYYSVVLRNAFGETSSAKVFLNVVQVVVWGDAFTGNTNTPKGLTNLIAITAGNSHVAALRSDGTVNCWLANAGYIFGSKSVTNIPPGATNISAIQSGPDHIVALRSNGTVVAWGGSTGGQTNVPPNLSNVVAVAAGQNRSFAIRLDGSVVGWGTQGSVPPGLSNVVAITTASPQNAQNFALLRDGSVFGWPNIETALSVSNAIAVDGGSAGFLALKKDGTLWSSTGRVRLPENLSNLVAVAANNFMGIVLKTDGSVVASEIFGKVPTPLLSNVTAIAVGGVQTDFGVALIGNGAPVITLQPVSQAAQSGAAIQLHARAVGIQPMSFQWQLENLNIPGATNSSLSFTNLLVKDTGNYRMLASNALGSTFSATARLTIPFNTNLPAALNATNLFWSSGLTNINPTNATWFAQIQETHDGDVAAQSGAISHNQQMPLSTSVYGPGILTFWWKVSSEGEYDFLRFNIDSESEPRASISGETGWEKKTFSIPQGSHILRWTYLKDGTVSSGRDAGWLDEVTFTRPIPTIIRHPWDQTVLMGSNATLPAIAESAYSMNYQWLKNGTNLPGATAQYLTLTNVSTNDAGSYALKVSNLYGSVITSNAILTVLISQVFEPLQLLSDGSAVLWSRGVNGEALNLENSESFEIQASTNVQDWITLPITPILTNGSLMYRDTNSRNFPMRFYRIVEH